MSNQNARKIKILKNEIMEKVMLEMKSIVKIISILLRENLKKDKKQLQTTSNQKRK